MSEVDRSDPSIAMPVLDYAPPEPLRRWYRTIMVLLWIGTVGVWIAAPLCTYDVETILVSGPALLANGFVLTCFAGITRRWTILVTGLEHVMIVVGVFLLINVMSWSPRQAQVPVTAIAWINAIVASLLAARAIFRLRHADTAPLAIQIP